MTKWGYLRETSEEARNAGLHPENKLHRTGLDEYLKTIFPATDDWIHNRQLKKELDGRIIRTKPDYRSDSLMTIVEFDGLQHYTKPDIIRKDRISTLNYKRLGYKVVRIPYFIQLTNMAIEKLFGVCVDEPMFDPSYASLDASSGSPAYLCPAGLDRMVDVFIEFPEQLETNLKHLKELDDDFLTGASVLESAFYMRVHKVHT